MVRPTAHDWQRAAVLRRAVATLRDGGFVFIVVDAHNGAAAIEVPFLGRTVRLARGAFALARMTGTPLVPLAAAWRGTKAEIVIGDPITPGDEAGMAARATHWLEGYVRAHPGEIGPKFVGYLSDAAGGRVTSRPDR